MKQLRTIIFWAHLATGITIGVIVLIMSATGVLLTYQRQIQAWADTRDLPTLSVTADPLGPEALLARVREQQSRMITGIRWQRGRMSPVEVQLGRESVLFVDPYSGAVLGDGSERARAFFRAVTDVHRWLGLNGRRPTGRAVTGAANLAFLFMVLSGFYLWWPRNLTARAFRSVLMFRRGLRAKARDFNWHNVIGFWALVPLSIIIASAVVISYGWAGALVERLAAEESVVAHTASNSSSAAHPADDRVAYAELLARAAAHVDDWRSITMQLPPRGGEVTFVIDRGNGGQPQRIGELTLAERTGDVVAWAPFSSRSRAVRVRSMLRFAHTGEAAGIAGQTLAGIVSAGAVLLVWTGVALALRRLGAWRRRRRKAAA